MDKNIPLEIDLIETMLLKGEYTKANQRLTSIKQWEELSIDQLFKISILQTRASFELGKYQESHALLESFKKEYWSLLNKQQHLKFLILESDILLHIGSFKDSLSLILEQEINMDQYFDSSSFEYKQLKVKILKIKGVCYRATGELVLVEETLNKGLVISKEIKDTFETAEILDRLAMHLIVNPETYEKALSLVNESLKIRKELGNTNFIAQTLNRLGILIKSKGNLRGALTIYKEALSYAKGLENKDLISILRNNIGGIYDAFGELNEALENYTASLKLSQETKNQNMIAVGFLNIASVYQNRGELDHALENYEKALKYLEEQGYQSPISSCLHSMGLIYYNKGELTKAAEYLHKSIDLSKEEKHVVAIGSSLYELIRVSLDTNNLDSAKKYLDELEEITQTLNSKSMNQRFKIAESILLMTSTRFQNRAKAERLLKEVINDEVVDHSITERALLVICELLLDELKITGSKEVLDELNIYVSKLEIIAHNQHSYLLLSKTYWLQSQLALIALNLTKAKSLLTQAQLIAEEKNLHRLILKIDREYDLLLSQAKQWARLKEEDASLEKRMSMLQIDDLIQSMTSKREIEMLEYTQENPVYLLVLSQNGKSLFTRKFLTLSTLDDALIGGFIAAINSFAIEIFETTGHIEIIKHQEYTLIIKVEEDLLFAYVYKGQSFTALSKLTEYVEKISSVKYLWNSLKEIARTPANLDISFKLDLERKADSIFVT